MVRIGWGMIRRFFLTKFRKKYVQEQLKYRKGECKRCGLCCKELANCPYLEYDENGLAVCRIYERRFENCVAYPIDERCFRGVSGKCGFYFEYPETDREKA